MNNIDKEDKDLITINAPRSNCVWSLQTLSLSPFGTAIMILRVFFNSNSHRSFAGILPFMAILLAAGFLLIYIPQTYMTRIIFDRKKRSLTKMSKGHKPIAIDLSEAQQIISAGEYTSPGVKYSMVILDKKGESLVIFNEDVMRSKPWIGFREKYQK